MKVRFLASFNRGHSFEVAKETRALLEETFLKEKNELWLKYVVGVELSGDPRVGNFKDYEEILHSLRKNLNLKVTLHCAETKNQMIES